MEHTAKKSDGSMDYKILKQCSLPLTGVGVVDMIITNLGVFEVQAQGLAVLEMAPGVTQEIIREQTACPLHF